MSFLSRIASQARPTPTGAALARPKGLSAVAPVVQPTLPPEPAVISTPAPVHASSSIENSQSVEAPLEAPIEATPVSAPLPPDRRFDGPPASVVVTTDDKETPAEVHPSLSVQPVRQDGQQGDREAARRVDVPEQPVPAVPPPAHQTHTTRTTPPQVPRPAEIVEDENPAAATWQPPVTASPPKSQADLAIPMPPAPAAEDLAPITMPTEERSDEGQAVTSANPAQEMVPPSPVQPVTVDGTIEVRPAEPVAPAPIGEPTHVPIQTAQQPQPQWAAEPHPTLHIGQIDVVVAEPAPHQTAPAAHSRLAAVSASRRYLRRL